jgi:hypothetical protein
MKWAAKLAYIGKDRNAKTTKNPLGTRKYEYRRDADIKLEKNKG